MMHLPSFSGGRKLLAVDLLFSPTALSQRGVSHAFLKPHPRKHRRRLFEAALEPVLPPELEAERRRLKDNSLFSLYKRPQMAPFELDQVEQAIKDRTEKWLNEERFRLMAVCQLLHINEEDLWLMRNQFRLNGGVEVRADVPAKIWRQLFQRSQLCTLEQALLPRTCMAFAHELDALKPFFAQCDRYENFITPLVVVVGSRLLPMEQARELARLDVWVQTVQLLDRPTMGLVQSLNRPSTELVSTLTAAGELSKKKEEDDGQK